MHLSPGTVVALLFKPPTGKKRDEGIFKKTEKQKLKKKRQMKIVERKKIKRESKRLTELPVEAATREPINANCGDAFCEKDCCPEPGWQPPPHLRGH
jgi:hypothetical protein